MADDASPAAFPAGLRAALEKTPGLACVDFTQLGTAQVALFYRGPGPRSAAAVRAVEEFLRSRSGLVVLGATAEAWRAVPGFVPQILGAVPGGPFAGGAAMSVINLYPHPIFAGVNRFETTQPMAAFGQLADDAQYRRMKSRGLCVNLFANHHHYWGDQHYTVTVGPDRAERMNACRSALEAGVP